MRLLFLFVSHDGADVRLDFLGRRPSQDTWAVDTLLDAGVQRCLVSKRLRDVAIVVMRQFALANRRAGENHSRFLGTRYGRVQPFTGVKQGLRFVADDDSFAAF